ncbi:MAG: metal ABC transporter permease, partial [Pseudomonadota bacterium]
MSELYSLLVAPFVEFAFMRRALAGVVALSVGAAPVGVFLMLRRMSLVGDAMAHAILPGAAIGYLLFGLAVLPMTFGGLVVGVFVAVAAGFVARTTVQLEDASLAAFYLISLSLGVAIISIRGSSVDLMQVLFGSVLAIDDTSLMVLGASATVTLLTLAVIYRALVAECVDQAFLRAVGGPSAATHFAFLVLVVVNLVAGFLALGTLLAVGLMMLPAAAARFWVRGLGATLALSIALALAASISGLLISYYVTIASGPAITLVAGFIYIASLVVGREAGWVVGLK